MTLHTSRRRTALAGARTGFVMSTTAFVLAVVGTIASDPVPAVAATADEAQITAPFEAGGAPLAGGGGDTDFTLALPEGAACAGDATAGYQLHTYMVAAGTDPGALTFDGAGPTGHSFGAPQSAFRAPLYQTTSESYVAKFPAAAAQPGGPGLVVNIPAFDYMALQLDGGDPYVLPGNYNIGIACWRTTDSTLDRFWNAAISVTADAGDPVGIAWTASAPATATSVALTTDPAGTVAPGDEVTLTATLDPAGATGTVTFRGDGDPLGDPVAVSGGSATFTTTELPLGDHVLTAAFSPADGSGFAASTSGEVVLTIGQVSGSSTTTTTTGGSTTSTTLFGSVTTTAPTAVGGVTSGAPLGSLARTGGSLSMVVWAVLMVIFGRMAILLGRKPTVRPARLG